MKMKKIGLAIVAVATLALSGCGNSIDPARAAYSHYSDDPNDPYSQATVIEMYYMCEEQNAWDKVPQCSSSDTRYIEFENNYKADYEAKWE